MNLAISKLFLFSKENEVLLTHILVTSPFPFRSGVKFKQHETTLENASPHQAETASQYQHYRVRPWKWNSLEKVFFFHEFNKFIGYKTGGRQWSTRPTHIRPAVKTSVVSLDFEKWGRTDNTCEYHYRPCVLCVIYNKWLKSWGEGAMMTDPPVTLVCNPSKQVFPLWNISWSPGSWVDKKQRRVRIQPQGRPGDVCKCVTNLFPRGGKSGESGWITMDHISWPWLISGYYW